MSTSTGDNPTFITPNVPSPTPTPAPLPIAEPIASTKHYSYKKLPTFNPRTYYAWRSDVKIAFQERKWLDYLEPPDPEIKPLNQAIVNSAHAFIYESIPADYKMKVINCRTAYEVWDVLEMEFGARTKEYELSLQYTLVDMRKSASEDIDKFIQRFERISGELSQLRNHQLDASDLNTMFVRSLDHANIPNEAWERWVTRLGRSYLTMRTNELFSDARSFYSSYILPKLEETRQSNKSTSSTAKEESGDAQVRATQGQHGRGRGKGQKGQQQGHQQQDQQQQSSGSQGQRGRGGYRGRGRGGYSNSYSSQYPRDPNAFCTHCQCPGHSIFQCVSKTKDPNAYCSHCQRNGHSYENCYRRQHDNDNRSQYSNYQQSNYQPSFQSSYQQSPRPSAPPSTQGPGSTYDPASARIVKAFKANAPPLDDVWLADSCCTESMTSNHKYFHTYDEFETPRVVSGIGEGQLVAYGSGSIVLQSIDDDHESQHTINNVWYVPHLKESFISLNSTIDSNLSLQIDDDGNLMLKSNIPGSNFSIRTSRINRMTTITNIKALVYTFTAHAAVASTIGTGTADTNDYTAQLWHERLGHAGADRLKCLGIIWKPGNCRECIMGKQTREPFRPNPSRSLVKLHRIHSDLCGPITPSSYGNARYVITFTDECSRYCWAYTINDKHASTIVDILKQWIPLVQNQASTSIKFIFTDRGNEYLGKMDAIPYLRSLGIQHEQTAANSSKSNGIAERMNRTIFDIVRPMMLTANAPTPFWAEAVDTALKIRNRLPTKSLNNISPHEAWFNESPNVDKLRQFGCIAYALDLRIPRGNKIDSRSAECCFLGYESVERHVYRLWDPERNQIIISRDVEFMESKFMPRERFANIPYRDTPLFIPDYTVVENSSEPREIQYDQPRLYRPEYIPSHQHGPEPQRRRYLIPPPNYQPTDDESSSDDEISNPDDTDPVQRPIEDTSPTQSDGERPPPPVERQLDITTIQSRAQEPTRRPEPTRRSERPRKLSRRAREAANLAVLGSHPVNINDIIEPFTFDEAMSLPEAQLWLKACQEELNSLNRHGTFRLCKRPPGRKIVGTKWVFKIKDPESKNPRYKARLVAQGYSQVEGLDYNETRASVVKITSIKIVLSLAARLRMLVHQFDVETAFLNGRLTITIYVEQPPGFIANGFEDCVLLLEKALYGLKQAGFEWLQELRRSMNEIGYRPCEEDENIFISHDNRVIVAVYVDDILMIAHEEHRINELANEISKFFTIRPLGPVKRFLSLDIYRPDPRGDIYISQGTYIRRVLQRFNMQDANPVKTPTLSSVRLHK